MKLRHKKMAGAAARSANSYGNWIERGDTNAYWSARMWHFKFRSVR